MADRAAAGKRPRTAAEKNEHKKGRREAEAADAEEYEEEDTAAERASRWKALEKVLGASVPEGSAGPPAGMPAGGAAKPAAKPKPPAAGAKVAGGGGDFAARMREKIQQKQAWCDLFVWTPDALKCWRVRANPHAFGYLCHHYANFFGCVASGVKPPNPAKVLLPLVHEWIATDATLCELPDRLPQHQLE
ncbi:hypothetical protein T492DRAFT_880377 [Pavlovales sp. CCMP2436]|nr:hypothetical protein T492DRAFT_880377 [Pavlovales sp. CCMP2436]